VQRAELAQLMGAKEGTTVSRELRSLKTTGLLIFAETAIESPSGLAGCGILIVGLVLVAWAIMQNRRPS
jgi:hypothetical protein